MKIGEPGKLYSFAVKNNMTNSNKPTFYVGELIEEDETLLKIKDRFGLDVVIRKDEIIRMKELIKGSDF